MPDEPEYCCPDDTGGSHYHCHLCGCVCGMMGHSNGTKHDAHCPPKEDRPAYAARFVVEFATDGTEN